MNSDLDVCRICPKMFWMYYEYLVGISHFAKYGTNRPLLYYITLHYIF